MSLDKIDAALRKEKGVVLIQMVSRFYIQTRSSIKLQSVTILSD